MSGKQNSIRMDDRNVYSASGRAYPRTVAKNVQHHAERRLPYVKRVTRGHRQYYYFTGPERLLLIPLPQPDDVGFDHAYLSALAQWEGVEPPEFQVRAELNVYFIGPKDGPIKIGVAEKVDARFRDIQAHSPLILNLLAVRSGGFDIERAYHKRFATHRLHGEWFSPHEDILAEIAALSAHRPVVARVR